MGQVKQMQEQMTRSDCPICGEEFPHGIAYTPSTCGRHLCLQEAARREREKLPALILGNGHDLGEFARAVDALGKAGDELLVAIKKDSNISSSMIDYWKNQGVND